MFKTHDFSTSDGQPHALSNPKEDAAGPYPVFPGVQGFWQAEACRRHAEGFCAPGAAPAAGTIETAGRGTDAVSHPSGGLADALSPVADAQMPVLAAAVPAAMIPAEPAPAQPPVQAPARQPVLAYGPTRPTVPVRPDSRVSQAGRAVANGTALGAAVLALVGVMSGFFTRGSDSLPLVEANLWVGACLVGTAAMSAAAAVGAGRAGGGYRTFLAAAAGLFGAFVFLFTGAHMLGQDARDVLVMHGAFGPGGFELLCAGLGLVLAAIVAGSAAGSQARGDLA